MPFDKIIHVDINQDSKVQDIISQIANSLKIKYCNEFKLFINVQQAGF